MQRNDNHAIDGRDSQGRGILAALEKGVGALSTFAAGVAILCMALMILLVLGNILIGFLSRFIDALPTNIAFAWEYGGYLMGVAFLMGMALTLKSDRHIRLTLLVKHSNRTLSFALELFASAVGALICLYLTATLIESSYSAWQSNRLSLASLTPLWIPKAGLALGAAVLTLQMLMRLVLASLGRLGENAVPQGSIPEGQ